MQAFILRIGKETTLPERGYPVELVGIEWREGGWHERSLATAIVPPAALKACVVPQVSGDGRDLGPVQAVASPSARLRELARQMFSVAFPGDVGNHWRALHQPDPLNPVPVRGACLILEVHDELLRGIRWEMMGEGPEFLAKRPKFSLVRGPVQLHLPELRRDDAVKVLLVVGSAAGDPAVLAEQELDELQRVFAGLPRAIEFQVLGQPTREAIAETMEAFRPDVFHFIGHGDRDRISGEPVLILHQSSGGDLPWSLADILVDFRGVSPAVALLNACHTILAAGQPGTWSMADLFADRLGVRAVLGMHDKIRGQTAGRLAGALYRALVTHERLDLALTTARGSADVLKSDDPAREWDWSLPYLRLTVLPEHVLPVARLVPERLRRKIQDSPLFTENQYFVDREQPHAGVLKHIQPDQHRTNHLILVTGESRIGKTQLVRCCLQSAALRGRLVKYVEFDSARPLTFLDVLQQICEGEEEDPIGGPLPVRAMEPFYQTLNAVLDGKDPADAATVASYPKVPAWKPLSLHAVENQVEEIFRSFRSALQNVPQAARDVRAECLAALGEHDYAAQARNDRRPFVLVLDQMASTERPPGDAFLGGPRSGDLYLRELLLHLVKPVAQGLVKDLLLVLATTAEGLPRWVQDLRLTPCGIVLERLPYEQFNPLAERYFEERGIQRLLSTRKLDPNLWRSNVMEYSRLLEQSQREWSPSQMVMLYSLVVQTLP